MRQDGNGHVRCGAARDARSMYLTLPIHRAHESRQGRLAVPSVPVVAAFAESFVTSDTVRDDDDGVLYKKHRTPATGWLVSMSVTQTVT